MSRIVRMLSDFAVAATEVAAGDCALPAPGSDEWVKAVVPGGVHESLLAAGRIAHPYRDDNEASVRWIEERDWWYRAEFDAPVDLAPDERLRLTFLGLDTVVEIWLNGTRSASPIEGVSTNVPSEMTTSALPSSLASPVAVSSR